MTTFHVFTLFVCVKGLGLKVVVVKCFGVVFVYFQVGVVFGVFGLIGSGGTIWVGVLVTFPGRFKVF